MYIHAVTVENFGIIKDKVSISPEKGINLIAGNNGSGKSTFFKALLLLLYNHTDKKLEEYVNENVSLTDGFSLSIDFDHNHQRYLIEYAFRKKGKTGHSERRLYVGDPRPEDPQYLNSDAVAYFETILPPLSFSGLVSEQGETDVITAKPSERREHLKEVYDLDFSEEIESIDADIQDIKNEKIAQVDKEIYALENKEYPDRELKELPLTSEEVKAKKKESNDLVAKISEINREEEQYESYKSTLSQNKKELERLKDQQADIRETLEEAKNKIEQDQAFVENPQSPRLESLKEKIEIQSEAFDEEIAKAESELESIKLCRLKSFDTEQLEGKQTELGQVRSAIESEKEKLELVEQGICPTCQRPFEEGSHEQHESNLDALETQRKELKTEIDALKKEKAEHDEKKEELDQRRNRRQYFKDRIEDLKTQKQKAIASLHQDIEEEKTLLEERIEESKASLDKLNKKIEKKKAEQADVEDRIGFIEKEIAQVKEKISQYEEDPQARISQLQEKLDDIERELDRYNKVKQHNDLVKEEKERIAAQRAEDVKKVEERKKRKDELLEKLASYEEAKSILRKEFPSYVISELIDSLEAGINGFIDDVYYKDLGVQITESRNSISITYGKQRKKDVAHLSGAEKQIVSLGYKNHLNQLMGLGMLILDEADSFYKGENAERLYNVLGSMKKHYNQLFIISHHDQAKEKLTGEHSARYFEFDDGKLVA